MFSVASWNLFKWKGVTVHDWPGERQKGMHATIASLMPDIICTQETAPEYLDTILECHKEYKCIVPSDSVLKANLSVTEPVRDQIFFAKNLRYRRGNIDNDSTTFVGWLEEGNIIWRSDKFSYVSHGAIDVGIEESEERRPKRRLFYVYLKQNLTGKTLLVSTAHLTWEGGSGKEQMPPYFTSERCKQATNIVNALSELDAVDGIIFSGDMNDSWHVPFIMKKAGLMAYDFALNLPTEMTHPARPCFHEERIPSQTRDWIFSNGKNLKPILGRVCGNMTLGLNRHPSDHFPVMCIYDAM